MPHSKKLPIFFVHCKEMPGIKKTYKTETNHGDFSLMAYIATPVWDFDLEIKHMCNFAVKLAKTFSTISH